MIIPDVNVLVHAWWAESPEHERARAWLEDAVAAPEVVGVSELVLSGAARVLTHPRVTNGSFTSEEVLIRADELRQARGVAPVRPTGRHWGIFRNICVRIAATGNVVPDCYHAALAVENDATFVSADRFFERVDGLRWRRPW